MNGAAEGRRHDHGLTPNMEAVLRLLDRVKAHGPQQQSMPLIAPIDGCDHE